MAKRCFSVCFAVLVFFAACRFSPVSSAAFSGSVSAKSAILIDAVTGKVLYEKNAEERLPMASTTKVMSALLTLEQPALDEFFTVDPEAIRVEGSSMGLVEGDRVTLRALACGMLLPSGNDAANAAAVKIGGTVEAFIKMMNDRAKALGLSDTRFVTPSGLHDDGHYSTAEDMAALTREALKNPDFAAICACERMELSFGAPPYKRWLKNSNKLLSRYDGAVGVKTGFTDEAGRCLISAAERDGVSLICVTLNAPNDWADHTALLDYGFTKVTASEIPDDAFSLPTVTVTGGTTASCEILPYGAAVTSVPVSELTPVYHLEHFYYAPLSAGDLVGRVDYCYEGEVVATQPLMAAVSVDISAETPEKSGGNMFSDFFSAIFEAISSFVGFLKSF